MGEVGQVLGQVRRARRTRLSWGDAYVFALAVLVVASALGAIALRATDPASVAAAAGDLVTVGSLVMMLGTATAGGLSGPLRLSSAEATWLASAPLPRSRVVGPKLRQLLAVGLVVGVVAAGVLLLLGRAPVLGWALPLGLAPVVPLAVAGLAQTRGRPGWWGLASLPLALAARVVGPVPAGFLLGIVAGASWLLSRPGELSRYDLARRGARSDAMLAAAYSLDSALALDVAAGQLVRSSGRVRPRGTGWRALATADVSRVARRLPVLGAAMLLTDLAALAAPAGLGPALVAVPLMVLLALALGSLRTVRRAPGLGRMLPWAVLPLVAGGMALALANVPLLGIVLAIGGMPWWEAAAAAVAATAWMALAAIRLTSAPRPDFSTGMVMTEAGSVPLGALAAASRGWLSVAVFVGAAGLGADGIALAVTGLVVWVAQLVRLGLR